MSDALSDCLGKAARSSSGILSPAEQEPCGDRLYGSGATLIAEGAAPTGSDLGEVVVAQAWFKTCQFQVTSEIDKPLKVKGFLFWVLP
jgi:hypothetical protein